MRLLNHRALALGLLLMGLALPARAQLRLDDGNHGWPLGQAERFGYDDPWGRFRGHSERSARGGVRLYHPWDGRSLGREDSGRDVRRRWPQPDGSATEQGGVQVYVDPLPFLQDLPPDPAARPDFQRGRTPWFGGR